MPVVVAKWAEFKSSRCHCFSDVCHHHVLAIYKLTLLLASVTKLCCRTKILTMMWAFPLYSWRIYLLWLW